MSVLTKLNKQYQRTYFIKFVTGRMVTLPDLLFRNKKEFWLADYYKRYYTLQPT